MAGYNLYHYCLCASAAGPLENAISYLCVCVLLQDVEKKTHKQSVVGKMGKS